MQDMRVQSLGQEVPLEKKVATHGGATVHGVPKGLTQLSTHTGIHTPMGLEYSMNLSYRWGSSDLKKSDVFHITLLNLSVSGTFLPLDGK